MTGVQTCALPISDTWPGFFDAFFGAQYAGMLPVPVSVPVGIGGKDAYLDQLRRQLAASGAVAAVGVGPAGIHGWHVMVKGGDRAAMRSGVRRSLEAMERAYPRRTLKFSVDVDPVDMG